MTFSKAAYKGDANMYNTILFDLDNTILDFDAAEEDSLRKVISEMGIGYSDELLRQYQKVNNNLWRKLEQRQITRDIVLNTRFSEFFRLYDFDVDGKEIEQLFRVYLNNTSALVPNAEITLKKLKSMGKRIFSASNGLYATQLKRLTNAGIIDLFDGHFISENVGFEKTSPKFFDYCKVHISEFEMSSVIMVGDSPTSDIKGAIDSGIDSCFYQHNKNTKCTYAKYSIADIAELVEIVQSPDDFL